MSSLLIRREGEGDWHEPATTVYGNEQDLQDMLEDSPGLIPGLAEPADLPERARRWRRVSESSTRLANPLANPADRGAWGG